MIRAPSPASLTVVSRSGLSLRAGQTVSLTILRSLGEGLWAVRIQGRTISARSDLKLQVGEVLRARVELQDKRLILKYQDTHPLRELLAREGLDTDAVSRQIAAGLIRSGVRVDAVILRRLKDLAGRLKGNPGTLARLLGMTMDKGLDECSPGLAALLETMLFGEEGGRGGSQYRRRRFPPQGEPLASELKEIAAEENETGNGTFRLFNHLRCGQENWVFIPYAFEDDEERLTGTIRLLYDPGRRRMQRMAMTVNRESTGGEPKARWLFILQNTQEGRRLYLFSGPDKGRAARTRGFAAFRSKVQNLGIEVDDTIHGREDCDGFSLPWEAIPYKRVDALG